MKQIMKTIMNIFLIVLLVSSMTVAVFAEEMEYESISSGEAIIVSLVNQDPDPAVAGEIVELRVGVQNNGQTPAEDLVVKFQPEYPFEAIAGEDYVKEIGTLSSIQSNEGIKVLKFKVKVSGDAREDTYQANVLQYKKGYSSSFIEHELDVDVKSNENAEIIYINKVSLIPGSQDELEFTIHNVGNTPLEDLTFSWFNEDEVVLPVGSADTKYIDEIPIGEKKTLTYDVIADSNALPGLYKLILSLTYDDPITGIEKTITNNAGIYIGGATDFEIAFSEYSQGEISFTVANVGSNPAYSVAVKVPEQQGWNPTGASTSIIGNLNNGDYTIASFDLQGISPTISLEIIYTDTRGERITIEKNVSMGSSASVMFSADTEGSIKTGSETKTETGSRRMNPISSMSNAGSNLAPVITVAKYVAYAVILLLVGFFGFKYYKKKNLKKRR